MKLIVLLIVFAFFVPLWGDDLAEYQVGDVFILRDTGKNIPLLSEDGTRVVSGLEPLSVCKIQAISPTRFLLENSRHRTGWIEKFDFLDLLPPRRTPATKSELAQNQSFTKKLLTKIKDKGRNKRSQAIPALIKSSMLRHQGLIRPFHYYVPQNKNIKQRSLLFVNHGGSGDSTGLIQHSGEGLMALADKNNTVLVWPNAVDHHWNEGSGREMWTAIRDKVDDIGYFNGMIDYFVKRYDVQEKAIFACGISNGGMMCHRLALQLSNRISGIVSVSSAIFPALALQKKEKRRIPVLLLQGTEDPLLPYEGGEAKALGKFLGKVISSDQAVEYWCQISGEKVAKSVRQAKNIDQQDNCKTTVESWTTPTGKLIVRRYKIDGGGHTWPGEKREGKRYLINQIVGRTCQDFSASEVIFDFMKEICHQPNNL
jgi:polyhydroxybutyrate depolymerase